MIKKRILLLGASGFLGKRIKKKLKYKFIILSPSSKKLNLLNLKKVDDYFKKNKVSIILNCSWLVNSVADSIKLRKSNCKKNIKIANNLFSLSQKYSIKNFLNISSINSYRVSNKKLLEKNLLKRNFQSSTPEGLSKIYLIKLFGKISNKDYQYKNLLLSNIYGFKKRNNLLFLDKLFYNIYFNKKYKLYLYNKSKLKIDYLYIDDAVQAINFFLNKMIKGEIKHSNINIASGKNYSVNKILTLIKKEIPFKIQYLINHKKKQPNLKPSILVAKNYGWEPKISITKGIERTCAIYKKNII